MRKGGKESLEGGVFPKRRPGGENSTGKELKKGEDRGKIRERRWLSGATEGGAGGKKGWCIQGEWGKGSLKIIGGGRGKKKKRKNT